ncbi:MAG: hypothetical protein H6594_05830 [Flavobacteriales bacterium]|nr:hypothetical protein [Flavobacteriales bacterium]
MQAKGGRLPLALLLVVTAAIGLAFISNDSLWIDEGNTAYKALRPTITSWYHALISEGGSDAQMPGYMFFAWLWAKTVGTSEIALRASNLVWLFVTVLALRRRPMVWVALLSSPFLLYYLNELRPYMMQIAAAAITLEGLLRMDEDARIGWRWVLAGSILLCSSSLTGVVWVMGVLAYVVVDDPGRLRKSRFWSDLAWAAPILAFLGWFYLRSLLLGQAAASMGGGLLRSLGASAYELIGLMGLGPGRIELREDPASALAHAWLLTPAALVLMAAYAAGAWSLVRSAGRNRLWAVLVGIGLPMLVLCSLIFLKDFRLLGRHLAPLSVVFALGLSRTLSPRIADHRPIRHLAWIGWAAVTIGVVSAIMLRFADRHKKDDYRDAVGMAKTALENGRTVLWAADHRTAGYYGLFDAGGDLVDLAGTDGPPDLKGDELVILTKPDLVDPSGRIRDRLTASGFTVTGRLQAFTIWERTADNTGTP